MKTSRQPTAIELSGNETDEQLKAIAWDIFCALHPVEAYYHDPDAFWESICDREPDITRGQMVERLDWCSTA